MYLVYVDESGDPGLNVSGTAISGSSFFTRTAILIPADKWFEINVHIKKFRSQNGIPNYVEFHATEIRKGQSQTSARIAGKNKKIMKKNWWGHKFRQPSDRQKLISSYLKSTVIDKNIDIITASIDKAKIDSKKINHSDDSHSIKNRSLTFLTERVNEFLAEQKSKGLLIFDSVNSTDDGKHRDFQRWLYKESENISNKNFVETILFADSAHTEFLQLVDLCANSYWRKISGFSDADYQIIKNKIYREKIWP